MRPLPPPPNLEEEVAKLEDQPCDESAQKSDPEPDGQTGQQRRPAGVLRHGQGLIVFLVQQTGSPLGAPVGEPWRKMSVSGARC